jgi:hypothetical protein
MRVQNLFHRPGNIALDPGDSGLERRQFIACMRAMIALRARS